MKKTITIKISTSTIPKARNPLFLNLFLQKSGSHAKNNKQIRNAEKIKLKKNLL